MRRVGDQPACRRLHASVLVIRLDGIGDALALTPLLAAFRSEDIPVDLVLRAENASIFSPGAVRNVDVAPWRLRSNESQDLDAMYAFARTLGARQYTHALVATEDPSGYRIARASGIPQRMGSRKRAGENRSSSLWVRAHLTQTVHRSAGLRSPLRQT